MRTALVTLPFSTFFAAAPASAGAHARDARVLLLFSFGTSLSTSIGVRIPAAGKPDVGMRTPVFSRACAGSSRAHVAGSTPGSTRCRTPVAVARHPSGGGCGWSKMVLVVKYRPPSACMMKVCKYPCRRSSERAERIARRPQPRLFLTFGFFSRSKSSAVIETPSSLDNKRISTPCAVKLRSALRVISCES